MSWPHLSMVSQFCLASTQMVTASSLDLHSLRLTHGPLHPTLLKALAHLIQSPAIPCHHRLRTPLLPALMWPLLYSFQTWAQSLKKIRSFSIEFES